MNNLIINGIKRLENSIQEVRRDYSPEQLVKINDFVSSYDEMTLQLFNDCISNAAYIISRKLGSNNYLDTLSLDDDTIQLLDFIEYRAEQKINLEYFNSYFESKNTRFYDDEIEFKSYYLTMEIDEQLQNLILKLEKDRLNCDLNSMLTNDNIKLNPDITCSSEENTYLEEFKNFIHKLLHSYPDYTYNEIKYQKFVNTIINSENDKIYENKAREILDDADYSTLFLTYLFHINIFNDWTVEIQKSRLVGFFHDYDKKISHIVSKNMINIMIDQISNDRSFDEQYIAMVQNNTIFNKEEAKHIYNLVDKLDVSIKKQVINFENDPICCKDDIESKYSKYQVTGTNVLKFKILNYEDIKSDLENIKRELKMDDGFKACLSLDEYLVDGDFVVKNQFAMNAYQKFYDKIADILKDHKTAIVYNDCRDFEFVYSTINYCRSLNEQLNELQMMVINFDTNFHSQLLSDVFERDISRTLFVEYEDIEEEKEKLLFEILANITMNQIHYNFSDKVLVNAIKSNYLFNQKQAECILDMIEEFNFRLKLLHAGKLAKVFYE